MLTSRKIIAFVATADPSAAETFYAGTLGLRLVSKDEFALVFDAGGTVLRVAIVPELRPAGYTVLGWIVPDISRAVRDLGEKGVLFQRYHWMEQDTQGIWSAPGGAKIAWFSDPAGNTLSLTEVRKAPARRRASPGKGR
jgi:catechol 2,3-dioxygenase-like lactoylglutathione lyase family enzyme